MSPLETLEEYFRSTMSVGDQTSITQAFRESVSAEDADDMFTLAYQWQDKPHRHVIDLCEYVDLLQQRAEKAEARGAELECKNIEVKKIAHKMYEYATKGNIDAMIDLYVMSSYKLRLEHPNDD
jgi:hypothetical protein